ncbi:hypothetical protein Droror1_Dr00000217, partial [Drosera rotundifolia]
MPLSCLGLLTSIPYIPSLITCFTMKDNKMAMELPYTIHKLHNKSYNAKALDTVIIMRLSNRKALQILAQALVLALVITALPWLGTNVKRITSTIPLSSNPPTDFSYNVADLAALPLLFRDLVNEGLIKRGDKALIVGNNGENESNAIFSSMITSSGDVNVIHRSDSRRQGSVPDEAFDFVFTNRFNIDSDFIDRTLKLGGIAVLHLENETSMSFNKPVNYKIVYLRRLSSTFIALRKTTYSEATLPSSPHRKLLVFTDEERKAVLKKLEDVLLEPPRSATGKSRTYLKRTKYLPDLLNDSLESYSRRVFIDVGSTEKDGTQWFEKHYPTRNKDFEKYVVKTVPDTNAEDNYDEEETSAEAGMSEWLRKNVKEEEYVVMKAEAEVVEEMLNNKGIELVDELFMECKPKGKGNYTRRAYWECLALYGRLRDLGVA